MANSAQAIKRARQNDARALHNSSIRSEFRTAVKRCLKLIEAKSTEEAKTAFQRTSTLADRIAGKGAIAKNKASRVKSRLNKKLRELVKGE